MKAPDRREDEDAGADQARSKRVEEFYTNLAEIGMEDVELEHARQAHIALTQRAVYFVDNRFCAAKMKREREYTERVSVNLLAGDGLTYALLIRSGEKNEGNGRTFYVAQHADLVDDLPRLVEEHGFEFTDIRSEELLEDLPDEYTDEF